ncbi:hypothetical protein ACHWQZ_G016217 [Mnemiopsis leidyi]
MAANLQFVPGRNSGSQNPILNGFRFILNRRKDDATYWKCSLFRTGCSARITTEARSKLGCQIKRPGSRSGDSRSGDCRSAAANRVDSRSGDPHRVDSRSGDPRRVDSSSGVIMIDQITKIIQGRTFTSKSHLNAGFRYSRDSIPLTDGRQAWRCVKRSCKCPGRLYTLDDAFHSLGKPHTHPADADDSIAVEARSGFHHNYQQSPDLRALTPGP